MKSMSYIKGQRGFTLLEIMFVIIVMAIMAVSGVSLYNHKIQNLKVAKAATEMQQWLSAGLNYYNANGYWPGETATDQPSTPPPASKTPLQTLVMNHFMPSTQATFNTPWSKTNNYEGTYTKQLFTIQVKFPNATIAREVASRLPDWNFPNSNDKTTIAATVTAPGLMPSEDKKVTSAIITLGGGKHNEGAPDWSPAVIPAPKCSGSMYPDITYVPVSFHSPSGLTRGINAVYLHAVPYADKTHYIDYNGNNENLRPAFWSLYGFVEAGANHFAETLDVNVTTRCVPYKPFYMNPNYYHEAPTFYAEDGINNVPDGVRNRFIKDSHTVWTGGSDSNYGPAGWAPANGIHGNQMHEHRNDESSGTDHTNSSDPYGAAALESN